MNSKTKIVVLRMKELIYTGIFVFLGILLILLLVTMFSPDKEPAPQKESAALYRPGVYTASILLGGNSIDLRVIVSKNSIDSIRLVNLDETIATMYPLMEPALDGLTEQIYHTQSLENIAFPEENPYTSMVLLEAIKTAVKKAQLPNPD